MKILFLADLHFINYNDWQNFLKIDRNKFDIIVILGDMEIFFPSIQYNFKDKRIIGVLGNHDYTGDLEYYNIINIHGKTIAIDGLLISGLEGCVKYKNSPDTPIHTQEEISNICNLMAPSNIIISHDSPYGIHDKDDLAHTGYIGLLKYIEKNNPVYCIHGHQHKSMNTKYNKTNIICVYGGIILDTNTGNIEHILKTHE